LTQQYLQSEKIQELIILIEESTRASDITAQFFIEPAPGTLSKTRSRFHHIVFGRRGSGKSSLLNKVHSENLAKRIPSAFVDLEKFKGAIYPDVLLSILIQTFKEFEKWLVGAAVEPPGKRKFWERLSIFKPIKRHANIADANRLASDIGEEVNQLNSLLQQEAIMNIDEEFSQENGASASGGILAGSNIASLRASAENSSSIRSAKRQTYESNKHTQLQKNILRYQDIFNRIKEVSRSDVYLILDDLYHINREDQASILDYFHKIGKGGNFWLKIGTVRHRTDHYRNGNPPVGIKLSDDVHPIDLDVTLEKYATTRKFLFNILNGFADSKEVKLDEVLTEGAKDRLVLVSGGVARDFLSLFRKSIEEARERIDAGKINRGFRVTAEDVNKASGQYYDDKLQELDKDITQDEKDLVMSDINSIRDFCFNKAKSNCILVEKDRMRTTKVTIGELVDLKILHPIRSGLTVSKRQGKRFDAYMLDFSFYTGERTKRDITIIEFWKSSSGDDILRKVSLIYDPS